MRRNVYEKVLIAIIIIAFVGVKIYFIYQSISHGAYEITAAMNNGDASHFLLIGKNIADYNVYSDTDSAVISESATWRPPLWPFILSFFFRVTNNITAIIILKAILEFGLLAYILYIFFKDSAIKLLYFFPFLLILIEPQYLKYSITFLTESLTSVLLLLLVIFFISPCFSKSNTIIISIISGLLLLSHPILIFCILSLLVFYLFYILKKQFWMALAGGLVFLAIALAWPLRNLITFHQGLYLTASQGATFSKGWNETVPTDFNNVNGDLADEGMNLKFISKERVAAAKGTLEISKLYKEGTLNFISQLNLKEKIQIVAIKLKSNFNPFPERPKIGFLESSSSFFRCLYLANLIFLFFRIFKWQKFNFISVTDKVYLVILSIFIGQVLMSTYIYTGLRFNAVYSLSSLFCFIYLISNFIYKNQFADTSLSN